MMHSSLHEFVLPLAIVNSGALILENILYL